MIPIRIPLGFVILLIAVGLNVFSVVIHYGESCSFTPMITFLCVMSILTFVFGDELVIGENR